MHASIGPRQFTFDEGKINNAVVHFAIRADEGEIEANAVVTEAVNVVAKGHAGGFSFLVAQVRDVNPPSFGTSQGFSNTWHDARSYQTGVQRARTNDHELRILDGRHDLLGRTYEIGLRADSSYVRRRSYLHLTFGSSPVGLRNQRDTLRRSRKDVARNVQQSTHQSHGVNEVNIGVE